MKYGIVFEEAPDGGIGAYLPDVPGVGVVGDNQLEARQLLRQAVRWQVEAMIEDGIALPEPSEKVFHDYLELDRIFVERVVDQRLRGLVYLAAPDDVAFVSVTSLVSPRSHVLPFVSGASLVPAPA